MNPLKYSALAAYYYGTYPLRLWREACLMPRNFSPVMILFYHRVADNWPNPWTISTRQFERHLDWICGRFETISLAEAQQRIRAGKNRRPAVCITFDDGYADNCRSAIPILIRRRIPVTYFVSLDYVLHGCPFPHDEKAGTPLGVNTLSDLRDMARAGVEIGAHTRTHPDLGQVFDEAELYDEIVAARDDLAAEIRHPVRYFAFPYGMPENLSAAAFRMAARAGYEGVCTAYGGYNFPTTRNNAASFGAGDPSPWTDPSFHLRRIHGDPELVAVKNWLKIDPRKEWKIRQLEASTWAVLDSQEERPMCAIGAEAHDDPDEYILPLAAARGREEHSL